MDGQKCEPLTIHTCFERTKSRFVFGFRKARLLLLKKVREAQMGIRK
jgi:hypothetical protein